MPDLLKSYMLLSFKRLRKQQKKTMRLSDILALNHSQVSDTFLAEKLQSDIFFVRVMKATSIRYYSLSYQSHIFFLVFLV